MVQEVCSCAPSILKRGTLWRSTNGTYVQFLANAQLFQNSQVALVRAQCLVRTIGFLNHTMVFLKINVFGSPSILESIFLILRQSYKVGISDFSEP